MSRTQAQLDQDAEANRQKLLAAEAAALFLLTRRRNEVVSRGVSGGRSLGGIAQALQFELSSAIASARAISRSPGIARLEVEAERAGATLAKTTLVGEAMRDLQRGRVFADRFASLWLGAARKSDDGKAPLGKLARAATLGTDHRIGTIASSEASEAFNSGRAKYVRMSTDVELLRVWHSERGKNTCFRCLQADGTIVGIRENFPDGEPGAVHARCLCSWALIGTSERQVLNRAA